MVNTRRSLGAEPLSPGLPYYSTPSRSRNRNRRDSSGSSTTGTTPNAIDAPSTAPPAIRNNNDGYQTPPPKPSAPSSRRSNTVESNTRSFVRQQSRLRRSAPAKSTTQVYLAYDDRTMLHGAPDGRPGDRDECPRRVRVIKERLDELEDDLTAYGDESRGDATAPGTSKKRFLPIQPRHATRSEVELVHTPEHYDYLESVSNLSHEELLNKSAIEENSKDLVWNEHTFDAALFAAGCAIECVDKVTRRDDGCARAISVTRPPGHHASAGSAGGFCFLNNVALAAQYALSNGLAKRVVIFDPDIHHGNGTQDITYDNENIFFISLHRYEVDRENEVSFYPGTGQPNECGSTKAKGMNLNVAWSQPDMGDPEFAAALSELILPVISAFHPDLFLMSAGFDAAEGDTLGDCSLTYRGYYAMTRSLLKTIGHDVPVVAILEGGYNLDVIPGCMEAIALAFLDEPFEPALRDLVKADSLPRELLEQLFGPIDDDDDDESGEPYNQLPHTEEQVERRQTMVRRGTTFGRQELLRFWRHPHREGELDVNIEPRTSINGASSNPPRGVKLSAIQDINLSMRYLRNCPFWKDMWSMNIVDLHDIPESAGVEEDDVSALEVMVGGLKI